MTAEVVIDALGARGDGIAHDELGEPIYVPFALPGERVRIVADEGGKRGRIERVIKASPDRVEPVCPHFGACGGCAMQHASPALYGAWKRRLIEDALAARAISAPLGETLSAPLRSRRRAVMSAVHDGAAVRLGFHKAMSHDLVDVMNCVVMEAAIEAALPALRSALKRLIPEGATARLTLLNCTNGLDILVETGSQGGRNAAAIAGLAQIPGAVRISLNGETLFQKERPLLRFGGIDVSPPPGAFVQAVAAASDAMAARIADWTRGAKAVADLFCGLGTFTFPLAARARVTAVESEPSLLSALREAARAASGIKPIEALRRDLMRAPLSAMELSRFDCVVFDPPRAGAMEQARQIAKSRLETAIAVSCNPGTFARDARALFDGGFQLLEIVPVDQFVFSSHVEIVALFRR